MKTLLIDPSLFKPASLRPAPSAPGREECVHEFPSTPTMLSSGHALWTCLKCGREILADPWELT
jgi:hypothetical protein